MNKLTFHGRPLTQKQQQAVIVCAVCALALILTIAITAVQVTRQIHNAKLPDGSIVGPAEEGAFGIDSPAVLTPTEDAGEEYLKDTLFIGDSNTVRLYNNGLVTLQQYLAREGLTIQDASTAEIVSFKRDARQYTIPEAVAKLKPRRVLITLGTNNADGSLSVEDFVDAYRTLIEKIQSAYPYTDIILNTIPPIPANHSKYPALDQQVIDNFNLALADLSEEMDCKLLNSAEALKDAEGYGQAGYYNKEDIHLTLSGLQTILNYYTTHAWETEDRRPDTDNIPARAEDFVSATNAPGTPKPTEKPEAAFTASYNTQTMGSKKNPGGTLTHGSDAGKTSLTVEVEDEKDSVTVKAVPNAGYVFVKWSDGSTAMERTDKNFKQNVNVTAMFAPLALNIQADKADVKVKDAVKVTAALSNEGYAKIEDVAWYVNNTRVSDASGAAYSFTAEKPGKLDIYAEVGYNGQTVRSAPLTIEIKEAPQPVNKGKLQDAIATAESKQKDAYTAESWDAMAKALDAARAMNEKKDATQADVNAAADALTAAAAKLVLKPVVTPSPTPTATPEPKPTDTPAPTATPEPAPTATPEAAPNPEVEAPQQPDANLNTPANPENPENQGTPAA